MKKNKQYFYYTATIIILFFGTEFFLRYYYGFCDAVLICEDRDYEYIAKPNQNRFRFRNHIKYNSFSMRSDEVDSSAKIILGFGDSVINGGTQTEQDSLATTILLKILSEQNGGKVQFLNISAGSWGPDNCFAYLKKHGDFQASCIYLFVSSHDAYDNMNFGKIVDVNKSFPSRQYKLAIVELTDRYLFPRIIGFFRKAKTNNDVLGINKKKEGDKFNSGFESFLEYSKQKNIPFIIYLHASKDELKKNSYNEQGQEIIRFAEQNNIKVIKDLELGLELSEFRDNIHINEQGQRKLAARVMRSQ